MDVHISNYTMITWLGASVTHFEALFYPFWVLPLITRLQNRPSATLTYLSGNQSKRDFVVVLLLFFKVLATNKVAKKEVDKV